MGTIKIGEAEEKLISEIEKLKEKHNMKMVGTCLGLNIAREQISETEEDTILAIIEQLDEIIESVEDLNKVIQGISFSQYHDEEKFSISWREIYDGSVMYYRCGYGTNKPVTEKQFIFALGAWDREVCRRCALVKELEVGYQFDSILTDIENDIHNLLCAYARDF